MHSKKRHGCVTAWLALMIVTNAMTAIAYLFFDDKLFQGLENPMSQSTLFLLTCTGAANLFFALMLLQWKKWAFWGFGASSVVILIVNMSIGLSFGQSAIGLIGIVLLFAILQIKEGGVSAWENLE